MGRDKVLGLSLAILLIGFGGAFCFRNEEIVEHGLKLARAKILDEGIAQRPGPKPYVFESKTDAAPTPKPEVAVTLGKIETIDTHDSQPSPRTARRPSVVSDLRIMPPVSTSPTDTPKSRPEAVDQFVSTRSERSRPEPTRPPKNVVAGPSASADPVVDKPIELSIRPNSTAFNPPDSLLDDSMAWQHPPDCRDGCPAMTSREDQVKESEESEVASASTTPTLVTYTVRRGDTLSRIAYHFLGDSNRYREILQANRDQLPSVNSRLKVGMTLRIPGANAKRPANSTVNQGKPARVNPPSGAPPRTRQIQAQPVSRTRPVPTRQTRDNTPPSTSTPVAPEPVQSTDAPRFLPVTKGPFWRSGTDSSTPGSRTRELSQRPPAVGAQSDVKDRDATPAKPQREHSPSSSDGNDEM